MLSQMSITDVLEEHILMVLVTLNVIAKSALQPVDGSVGLSFLICRRKELQVFLRPSETTGFIKEIISLFIEKKN